MTKKELLTGARWSKDEDFYLQEYITKNGDTEDSFTQVARLMGNKRTVLNVKNRYHNVLQKGIKKGQWQDDEDKIILSITSKGCFDWDKISEKVSGRTAKACRERYINKLDPNLNHSPFTPEEDKALIDAQQKYGNKWKLIANILVGRSENDIKNRFNSKKRLSKESSASSSNNNTSGSSSNKKKRSDEDDDSIIIFATKKQARSINATVDSDSEDENEELNCFKSNNNKQSQGINSPGFMNDQFMNYNYSISSGLSSLTNSRSNSPNNSNEQMFSFDNYNDDSSLLSVTSLPSLPSSSLPSFSSFSSLSFSKFIENKLNDT